MIATTPKNGAASTSSPLTTARRSASSRGSEPVKMRQALSRSSEIRAFGACAPAAASAGPSSSRPAAARRREVPGAGRKAVENAEELLLERKEPVLDECRSQRSGHAYSVLRSAIADAVTRQFLPLRFAW